MYGTCVFNFDDNIVVRGPLKLHKIGGV